MPKNEVAWKASAYPHYESYEQRLYTYFERFWPISIRQNGMMMAKAGFFYRGIGDIVTCSFCGVSLHKWLQNDDPIAEHRKFNPNCKFIRLLQDVNIPRDNRTKIFIKNFISFIQSIFSNFKSTINSYFYADSGSRSFSNTYSNNCKICLNEDSNILLLPCHHISTCISCTLCTKFCPICRCKIESVIKVYFA